MLALLALLRGLFPLVLRGLLPRALALGALLGARALALLLRGLLALVLALRAVRFLAAGG